MASLEVKISERKVGSEVVYEGSVSIPGLAPTMVARKSDGATQFASRSALSTVARSVAKNLGFEAAVLTGSCATSSKKAAKKAVVDQPVAVVPTGDCCTAAYKKTVIVAPTGDCCTVA